MPVNLPQRAGCSIRWRPKAFPTGPSDSKKRRPVCSFFVETKKTEHINNSLNWKRLCHKRIPASVG